MRSHSSLSACFGVDDYAHLLAVGQASPADWRSPLSWLQAAENLHGRAGVAARGHAHDVRDAESESTVATCSPSGSRISALTGTISAGAGFDTYEVDLGIAAGQQFAGRLSTSTSASSVRVAGSTASDVRTSLPRNLRPGYCGSVSVAVTPFFASGA